MHIDCKNFLEKIHLKCIAIMLFKKYENPISAKYESIHWYIYILILKRKVNIWSIFAHHKSTVLLKMSKYTI